MHSKISPEQIQAVEAQLQGEAVLCRPGSKDYEKSTERWSDIGKQNPGVVIRPSSASGIATAVKYAADNYIDLAVKGGGHSTDTSASSKGGILIDLGAMNKVTVNTVDQTVTAQGGALWADVNDAAGQHELAVVGGTASRTGVGGLTLRGGYGYLTPQHGLVIDNLLAATVVTAGGATRRASARENPNLFWALRGAGQNIGVAAELVYRAHPQRGFVWNGTRSYAPAQLPEVIEALNASLRHPEGRAAAQCVFSLTPETGEPLVSVILFFNGSEEDGRVHFARLLGIECVADTMGMKPYPSANTLLDALVPPGGRKKLVGVQLPPRIRPELAAGLLDAVSARLLGERDLSRSSLAIDFLDHSRVCWTPAAETAFPVRDHSLKGVLILQWTEPARDEEFLSWGESIQLVCRDEMRRAGLEPTGFVSSFLAYTSDDKVAPADMFGENAARLVALKTQYDPGNVFHKLNPLGNVCG